MSRLDHLAITFCAMGLVLFLGGLALFFLASPESGLVALALSVICNSLALPRAFGWTQGR
jgi:hypothetical protein